MWQMPQVWPQRAERLLQSVGLLSSTCTWILRPALSLGMSTPSMHQNPSSDLPCSQRGCIVLCWLALRLS